MVRAGVMRLLAFFADVRERFVGVAMASGLVVAVGDACLNWMHAVLAFGGDSIR